MILKFDFGWIKVGVNKLVKYVLLGKKENDIN